MKKHLLCIAAILMSVSMMAQDEQAAKNWAWSGIVGLNANATGMVNWAAGGKNNVTGTAFAKVRCVYLKSNISWDTDLDLEYGLSYLDQEFDKLQKSSDHIKFNTKFGWAFVDKWYLTASAGFQTQFDLGRNYLGTGAPNPIISNILAPSYTDISVGIDWKPNSIFSVYLSPVAGRITTAYISKKVNDRFVDFERDKAKFKNPEITPEELEEIEDYNLHQALQEKNGTWHYEKGIEDAYVKHYDNAKAELGLTLKGSINYTYKDLKIITGVTLFTPYAWDKTKLYDVDGKIIALTSDNIDLNPTAKYIGYRDNNRRFGNFDVDWNFAISYQLLKCLNVTFSSNLKYVNGLKIDKTFNKGTAEEYNEAAERVQFLGNLGLGVSYSF